LIRPRTHLPSLTCQIVARLTVCEQWDLRTPRAGRQGEIHAGFRTQPSERDCPKHRAPPGFSPFADERHTATARQPRSVFPGVSRSSPLIPGPQIAQNEQREILPEPPFFRSLIPCTLCSLGLNR
jgi:hypothetical protein